MSEGVVRFSVRQRVEHLLVMLLFVVLAVTGLPQKFHDSGWAHALVDALGGIQRVRFLHRASGVLFALLALEHLSVVIWLVASGRSRLSLVPTRKDFRDVVAQLRYYLRLSDAAARFDRFDYREKFEYWGLVIGAMVMTVTGFALLYPIAVTRLLPGELIPVAKVVHSNEGLLALLVVVTWHVYNAHLAPEVFPFNKSIFTGRISREDLRHHHPLEYERLIEERTPAPPAGAPAPPRQDRAGPSPPEPP